MEKEPLSHWLALLRAPGLGSCGINHLLAHFATPTKLLSASHTQLEQFNLRKKAREYLLNPDWGQIASDLAWLEQTDNHLITIDCPSYPPLLKEVPDPPPALFVHGSPQALLEPQLAIVGSRNPSQTGERIAKEFSQCLGASGLTITSGMAIGIDAAAHRGALETGGSTIAVAGTGLDRVYPARHHELAHQIAQQGALVSEFPPGTPPKRDTSRAAIELLAASASAPWW